MIWLQQQLPQSLGTHVHDSFRSVRGIHHSRDTHEREATLCGVGEIGIREPHKVAFLNVVVPKCYRDKMLQVDKSLLKKDWCEQESSWAQ